MICHRSAPDPKYKLHVIYATDCDGKPVQFVAKTEAGVNEIFNRARDHERKYLETVKK